MNGVRLCWAEPTDFLTQRPATVTECLTGLSHWIKQLKGVKGHKTMRLIVRIYHNRARVITKIKQVHVHILNLWYSSSFAFLKVLLKLIVCFPILNQHFTWNEKWVYGTNYYFTETCEMFINYVNSLINLLL